MALLEICMVKSELNNLIDEAFERRRRFGIYQGVRKFKHGEMFKNVWFTHSLKNQANIACESDLEKLLCMTMEFENAVKSYRPQPFKLKFDGFTYTPDFIVKLESGLYVIREAKRKAEAESSEYQEKFKVISHYCNSYGVEFEVFTESNINKSVQLKQNFLYHLMRGQQISAQDTEACFHILKNKNIKIALLNDVRDLIESLGFNAAALIRLIAIGLLHSNIEPRNVRHAYISVNGSEA